MLHCDSRSSSSDHERKAHDQRRQTLYRKAVRMPLHEVDIAAAACRNNLISRDRTWTSVRAASFVFPPQEA
jgi:hypothetical protein